MTDRTQSALDPRGTPAGARLATQTIIAATVRRLLAGLSRSFERQPPRRTTRLDPLRLSDAQLRDLGLDRHGDRITERGWWR